MILRKALLLGSILWTVQACGQSPQGIPHELTTQRAAVLSDVRYAIQYTLTPHTDTTSASETLRFQLKRADAPLLLDFRDGLVNRLAINGIRVEPEERNGHLLLPASNLRAGDNELQLEFTANIAPAQKAITRFEDHDDGSEYLYTLFVPMDASMAFPCFDQPDLKGRFQLTLTAPATWTVISNTSPMKSEKLTGEQTRTTFAETHPISTYLFAFAAGPFVKVHPVEGLPGLYVRKSKAKDAASEAPAVQQTAADGIRFLSEYFAQPFPFPKYDMVLIPGFAYGGMEHAGSTFLREEGVLFRSAPTDTNLLNRQILVLHELTHQWFGDFTTMRWFDDLWLKEGFAQYMAYRTLASLRPHDDIWKRFYEAIKPAAYAIDETQGTTPIYQDIPNLQDAKSAYGAIVYSKAPGVIKQLAYVLGEDTFRNGLRLYLAQHRYANAEWSDLIAAFEKTSGQSLGPWAEMWIKHRGMPEVDANVSCDDATGNGSFLVDITLTQHAVLGGDEIWPIATEIIAVSPRGDIRKWHANLNTRSASVAGQGDTAFDCPAYVFANNDDHAYGLFPLDPKSRAYVIEHIGATDNLFRRTLLWGSLWDSVRAADFDPAAYVRLALHNLPAERDESLAASILSRSSAALHRFVVSPATQSALTAQLEALAADRMVNDPSKDLRINWFRSLAGLATQPEGRTSLKALLAGSLTVPGVQLRQQDRWQLVTALLAYSDPDADAVLAAEQKRDPSGDGLKYAWIAQAARPDAATKQQYFDEYLHNPQRPEDWIEGSLGAFNYWNQSAVTEPYLQPSLAALAQIKEQRKIFFLVGWLNAFIGGQQSVQAQQQVRDYLQANQLDRDLRLKILQAIDELDRTVAIRKAFSGR